MLRQLLHVAGRGTSAKVSCNRLWIFLLFLCTVTLWADSQKIISIADGGSDDLDALGTSVADIRRKLEAEIRAATELEAAVNSELASVRARIGHLRQRRKGPLTGAANGSGHNYSSNAPALTLVETAAAFWKGIWVFDVPGEGGVDQPGEASDSSCGHYVGAALPEVQSYMENIDKCTAKLPQSHDEKERLTNEVLSLTKHGIAAGFPKTDSDKLRLHAQEAIHKLAVAQETLDRNTMKTLRDGLSFAVTEDEALATMKTAAADGLSHESVMAEAFELWQYRV
jgi:hypothetical protein